MIKLTVSYHLISYHIVSCPCRVVSFCAISYHLIYHIMHHIISYHIRSRRVTSCHVLSCLILSYRIVSYRISYYIMYHIISHHIIYHVTIMLTMCQNWVIFKTVLLKNNVQSRNRSFLILCLPMSVIYARTLLCPIALHLLIVFFIVLEWHHQLTNTLNTLFTVQDPSPSTQVYRNGVPRDASLTQEQTKESIRERVTKMILYSAATYSTWWPLVTPGEHWCTTVLLSAVVNLRHNLSKSEPNNQLSIYLGLELTVDNINDYLATER